MYRTIPDFINDFAYEQACTLKVFSNLTDESLTVKVHEKVRTLGFLAWHMIHTLQEMMALTGIKVELKEQQNYDGETAKELCNAWQKASASLVEEIQRNWTDETLLAEDNMYGDKWKRGTTLSILIKHNAHHRGQMEVIMRLIGLKVPGVYGPSNEEWAAMGMEAMQ